MTKQKKNTGKDAATGIALIAVLWMVAALSIIVTGVVHSIRGELKLTSSSRQAIEAVGHAEAAIAIVLQSMTSSNERSARVTRTEVPYRGRGVVVEIMPLNGLIDINRAPEPLLAALYRVALGGNPDRAAALADATVQARSAKGRNGREMGFEAIQDLLRVPGIDYELYAKLSMLITVDAQGSGRVNPQAAPFGVLAVLADGNAPEASALVDARSNSPADINTTALNGAFIGAATTSRYRFQATVALPDGGQVLALRDVDLRADPRLGLSWRILNADNWMQAAR